MANHKSALKRYRQSEKKRVRNHAIKTRVRNLVRSARQALQSTDEAAITTSVADASRALTKAVSKGVLHRNNASRRISRLAAAAAKAAKAKAAS